MKIGCFFCLVITFDYFQILHKNGIQVFGKNMNAVKKFESSAIKIVEDKK